MHISFIIVNATRIPPGPGPGHALVVRCQRLAAVCEQAGRSRQKQVKACRQAKESRGRQAEAGRRRGGNKKRSNVRGWGSLGLACKAAKSEHPPRSADTRGDWLKKQVAKTAKIEHADR